MDSQYLIVIDYEKIGEFLIELTAINKYSKGLIGVI